MTAAATARRFSTIDRNPLNRLESQGFCTAALAAVASRERPNITMTRLTKLAAVAAIALFPVVAVAADAAPAGAPAAAAVAGPAAAPSGDPVKGSQKVQMCQGCHGILGWRTAFPEVYHVPKIAGQHPNYIIAALKEYRSGQRSHPSMLAIAASLTDADMADIAAYYSQAPLQTAEK
jgi:cytochrome c553